MFIQEYCDSFCQTGRHYRVNIDVYRLEKENRKSFITCWYLVLAEAPVSSASGETASVSICRLFTLIENSNQSNLRTLLFIFTRATGEVSG